MRRGLALSSLLFACGCLVPGGFGSGTARGDGSGTGEAPTVDAYTPDLPTSAAAMLAFLTAGKYAAYPSEPALRAPEGPHGVGAVRRFLHPSLVASQADGAPEHPEGAGAVLELYEADGVTRLGWATAVKLGPSDGGFGWYWLEAVDRGAPSVVDAGEGLPACIGCHAAGDDYVLGARL